MINQVNKDSKRRRLYKTQELKRTGFKLIINSLSLSPLTRLESTQKLHNLPRSGSITRVRNRCVLTGRGRGVYRILRLSRITFRELASRGLLPGISKDSW